MGFSTSKSAPEVNSVHPAHKAAEHKRHVRESILSRYQHWRPDKTGDIPQDVSALVTAKLDDRERAIVSLDATALLEHIRQSAYSSVEVITAYFKVAVAAQDLTNCLTEIFFDLALERANELDEYLRKEGRVVGPLHGLPVSIKDHILVKGFDTSSGYTAWAEKTVANKDAVVVDLLRRSGAILYVKTANPQTLLSLETENNIFGRTVNPFNTKLSPGGSSGGEGALISSFGSPMGIGTDIGGSIRVPAAHCGLYGMKGSVARMPHTGLMGSQDGMDNIIGVVGPLTRSARDLALFARAMLDAEAWTAEHQVLEIPWKPDVVEGKTLPRRLSIAILADDGVVRPHPPLLRALEKYRKALVAAGHEVIDWVPMRHQEAWDLIVKFYFLDGGEEYYETFREGGEEPIATVAWILSHVKGRAPYTVRQTWKLNCERENFRAAALQHWNETKRRTESGRPVDAILTPAFATLAPPHDTTRWWGYSSYWNLVDYPGIVFPTGERLVVKDYPEGVECLPPARNDVEEFIRSQWNPKTYENAPVSLQLVGRRHNEEKLLAILQKVEEAASGTLPP
ncbi:amidase signature domain-containing protein [Cantharellus anzutake]|uniref:amidase signature domain-containing protein n=1 Tax=Cantharellus anzutake TaxID=1750568 RepID=UPI0019071507|nr:amidase signature domain-containing protein [Cantharellus anzutake]KAF8330791.1 amidase signature domain-containing protein [Cantharellus anzutake]